MSSKRDAEHLGASLGNGKLLSVEKGRTLEDNLERKNCAVEGLQDTLEGDLGREETQSYGMGSLDMGFVFSV